MQICAICEVLYSVCFFIGIYFCLSFSLVCYCLFVVCNWEVGTLGGRVWPVKDFNLPPQFSRLGTHGPASHVLCDFLFIVCVGVMGEVLFSFFSNVCFHASVLYTCFSILHKTL